MSKYKVGDTVWVKETIKDWDKSDNAYYMDIAENGGWFKKDEILCKTNEPTIEPLLERGRSEGYRRGMWEAWGLIKKLFTFSEKLPEIFDFSERNQYMSIEYVLNNYTPNEAKNIIEEWEKSKEEIKVGDICEYKAANGGIYKSVCVKVNGTNGYFLYKDGSFSRSREPLSDWKKTGRHIDIQSILEQIGGKNEQ